MAHFIQTLYPVVCLAILVVSIIAARRHRLTGLWILVLAAFLAATHSVLYIAFSSLLHSGHDNIMVYWVGLQFVPLFIAAVALCGFFVLAFSAQRGEKTDA
jgi:hypothetical protein